MSLTRRRKHYEMHGVETLGLGRLGLLLIAVVLQRPVKGSSRLVECRPNLPPLATRSLQLVASYYMGKTLTDTRQ